VWAQAEEEVCKEANRYELTKEGIGLQPVGQTAEYEEITMGIVTA
jgi:hypothetical protein